MTQTGMTILHSGLAPCGSMSHILHMKRKRREKYKLLLTSTQKMRDPKLIMARCCSIEEGGKSILFSLKVAKHIRVSYQLQLSVKTKFFSRNCGVI